MLTHTCVIPIPCPTFPYITLPYIGCITYIYHLYIGQTLYVFIYLVIYWFIYMCVCSRLLPQTKTEKLCVTCVFALRVQGTQNFQVVALGNAVATCHHQALLGVPNATLQFCKNAAQILVILVTLKDVDHFRTGNLWNSIAILMLFYWRGSKSFEDSYSVYWAHLLAQIMWLIQQS